MQSCASARVPRSDFAVCRGSFLAADLKTDPFSLCEWHPKLRYYKGKVVTHAQDNDGRELDAQNAVDDAGYSIMRMLPGVAGACFSSMCR